MKKVFSLTLVLMLVLGVFCVGAYAADSEINQLTLDDGSDFTVVKNIGQTETMTVKGLTSSWQKIDIVNKAGITWTTSNPSVAIFTEGVTVSGKDTVTVITVGKGRAQIKAHFDGKEIYSNIVVEGNDTISLVENVKVQAAGDTITFDKTTPVPLYSLKSVFGAGFNDADVLKKKPTAMHALLYALELKYDPDTKATWDWDWVRANVEVTSEGSFVTKIGSDRGDWTKGWQYKINNNSKYEKQASSIYELKAGDIVKWELAPWQN
ncbi:DUF4430 domain-containing protein [Crassaminicella indica]|uniref:DUF4430 domain-containing protein n=1 Tax=Crassaminicella indica TaxID=2855394 RepID=A0ABX8R9Y8_9CLOT|nr:DUF4430 domain-containing protein [Crassaminicella indica]QXM05252.1 DUF4430 domain-containing protein [Crassaminicella indica]